MSRAEYFSTGTDLERAVHDAVVEHLEAFPDVHVEYVSVGVFFKRARTFAELRPMRGRVRLSILLSRRLQDPRIVRTDHGRGTRNTYFVDLYSPEDVDDQLRDWLSEAYASSPA